MFMPLSEIKLIIMVTMMTVMMMMMIIIIIIAVITNFLNETYSVIQPSSISFGHNNEKLGKKS